MAAFEVFTEENGEFVYVSVLRDKEDTDPDKTGSDVDTLRDPLRAGSRRLLDSFRCYGRP